MSVVESKRTESGLEVFVKSNELAAFTVHICSNEKVFPKRYRRCLTSKIVDSVLEVYKSIMSANRIKVENKLDYELRENLQNQALANLEAALSLMDVAYKAFNLTDSKVENWVGQVKEVQKFLRAWKKSDYSRYKDKVSN